MRYLRAALPVLVFGLLLLTPHIASAATANFFGPIFPAECNCPTSAPDWGCVLAAVQNLINFAISIGTIIFVLVAAYAGILLMASSVNAENKSKAKSLFESTIIGLLITLSAWIAVDFIMKVLYNPSAGGAGVAQLGPWNSILAENQESKCLIQRSPPAGPTGVGGTGAPITGTGTPGPTGASGVTDASARSTLAGEGFSFSSSGSCNENRAECTYLGGIQPNTVSTLSALSAACGGGLTITGATEPGHGSGAYSHGNGYKIDLRNDAHTNTCIEGHATRFPAGDRGGDHGGTAYKDSCGNIYVQESNHWDILVTSACSF